MGNRARATRRARSRWKPEDCTPGGHNRTLSDSDHFLSSGVVLPTGKQKNSRIIIGRFLKLALDKQQKCLSFNSLKRAAKNSSI